MPKHNLKFFLILTTIIAGTSGYVYATTLDDLANTDNQTIGSQNMCGIDDDQWYQKSGKDFVTTPEVTKKTLHLQADDVNGQINNTSLAQGGVVGYKGDETLFADWALYDQAKDYATAGDSIYLTRQYDSIQGKWAEYYFDLNSGKFTQARAYYNKENLTFTGDEIDLQNKNNISVSNGFMTACDPNNPAWYLKADKINADYAASEGNAKNARFYYESIPVFYSPYLEFPLGQRKSGWLTPQVGGNSTTGPMIGEPFYWNMAPNYDMTITPEVWTNQGFMITDEFRYMSKNNVGSIYTEQLPISWSVRDDAPSYRWYYNGTDTYTPAKDWSMGYNYNRVSDINYFNDFGNFYSVTDNVNLLQNVFMNYNPTWGNASIAVQQYQTLLPYGAPNTIPIYSQYPAINLTTKPQDMGAGLMWNLGSSYTYFDSPDLQSGQRLNVYPSISRPFQDVWGYVTPKVGYNSTTYEVSQSPQDPQSNGILGLNLPIASVDGSLYFDKNMSTQKGSYTQTVEPRLYYLYIPSAYQGNLPVFDTSTATFNYNQLFSENQFVGGDRVNAANDITIGGSSRTINDANGNELSKLNLGYKFFMSPESQYLYGNYDQFAQLYLPKPNAIGEWTTNWAYSISSFANFQYDTQLGDIDYYSINMKWNPDVGKVLNVGYSYQFQMPLLYYNYTPGQNFEPVAYENQYALNVSGQWPIYQNKWYLLGRGNYDFTRDMLLNAIGGVEYNGGCYTISAVVQQFIYNYNQNQTNYMLNFNFKGIGNIGSGDQSNLLGQNISGYQSINSMLQNQTQY